MLVWPGSDGNKQSVAKIISILQQCITRLPKKEMEKVRPITRDGSIPKFQPIPILEFSCQPILIPILEFPNYF